MRSTGKRRAVFLYAFILACMVPHASHAAEILFSPATGSFAAEAEFSIKVDVNPGTTSVNAADGTITFDTEVLSVVSISKDGSVFSLWTADPSFSSAAGTISFSGGTPSPFSNAGTAITVKFKAKKAGATKLSVSAGSILAADGKGTNVYVKGEDGSYTITEAAAAPPPEEEAVSSDDANTLKPLLPVITSATHPKEDVWYATSTVDFSWKVPIDVTTILTGFSQAEDTKPTKSYKPSTSSEKHLDTADGVWFIFVQFKNEFGTSDVAKKKINVDTTPPNEFDFALLAEGDDAKAPKFAFQTEDDMSGIDRYEIVIGGTTAGNVKPADLVNGATPVPAQEGGVQKVTIKAIDKAGNVREVSKELTLPAVAKTVKGKPGEEIEKPPVWTSERIALIIFALIIGALAALNMMAKKNAAQEKLRVLQEVARVRDKNDKIFSAMGEEFEDLINGLDERPQLTPAERDFLENIKEALEISEELIDTGMEDLKKIIRG